MELYLFITSFSPHSNPKKWYYFHFTVKVTEAQRKMRALGCTDKHLNLVGLRHPLETGGFGLASQGTPLLLPQWNLSKVFLVLTFLRQLIGPMAEEEFLLNSIISPEDWRITRGLEDWRHSFLTFWVGLYSDQVPLGYIANPSAVILAQFQILVTSISSFNRYKSHFIPSKTN